MKNFHIVTSDEQEPEPTHGEYFPGTMFAFELDSGVIKSRLKISVQFA